MKKILFVLFLCSIQIFSQWSEQNSGISFSIFSLSAVNDDIVWASTSFSNVLRTTNGGLSWENVGANVPEPNGFQPCIFGIDANTAIFSCYDGSPVLWAYVYKTTNAGANWTLVFSQGDDAYISGIWIKPNNEGFMVGWPVGGRWSLWKTTNAGNNWDSAGLYIPEIDPSVWSFENGLFCSGSRVWFGARNKGIYYSSNNGTSWVLQELAWTGYAYPSAIWFENSTHGFSSADRNIIKTETSGMNWTIMPNTSGPEIIKGITGTGNHWWYVRFLSNKIYYTSNDGDTWIVQYTAPTNSGYNHITKGRNGGNKIWAARIDGGISVYNGTIGIQKIAGNIPGEFKLSQNYPNPFNPATKIRFDIRPPLNPLHSKEGKDGRQDVGRQGVVLKVYDILGREVQTLVNENLSPGIYEVDFDGTNYSSGVYYYTLKAENFTQTKKLVLVK
jgi:photosystem II stability/assembly factor-like uncharacterized protein